MTNLNSQPAERHYPTDQVIPGGLPGGFFIYEATEKEEFLFVDDNVIHMFGCDTLEEFLEHTGNCFEGMVYSEDLHKIKNEITAQTMFGEKRHDYVRYRIRTKQGNIKYIEDFGHLMYNEQGKGYFYVFIVDVDQDEYYNRSRNSFAEAEILSSARETDPLTGLFNMAFFYQQVHMLLALPENRRKDLAVIHFDIPNFKLYNERYGFRAGDELLCEVARVMQEIFYSGTAARFSDDHFVVCAVANSKEEIVGLVEWAMQQIMQSEDTNKRVRLKAGIYYLDDRSAEVGLACDHARLACNSIKGRHDTNCCIYNEALREKLRKQQYVVDHIDTAIGNGYIKVFYQPVIRVKTGEICGYEALVRWIDPVMGFLSPADFIETLEQFHLIHRVDSYVIERVCEDYQKLKQAGEPVVPVSINLSRLDFELCNIYDIIEESREKYGVPKHMLDLEITESALNENTDLIRGQAQRLHDAGYHIWIDDFGSGYSSLNVLADYTFDVLKLDLVFLRSYDHNPKTGTLLGYIVSGAHAIGSGDGDPL